MTTKTKTTPQVQNTTQTQNSPIQNTVQRRVITVTPRESKRGRPSATPKSRDYIVSKLSEVFSDAVIDLGDYETVRILQFYITTYSANSAQGLVLAIARRKLTEGDAGADRNNYGLIANLAFRVNFASGELKLSVKNAVRVYEPMLSNIINLTKDLDPAYVFK